MKTKKAYYLVIIHLFLTTIALQAQVTIGTDENPAGGALLHLKEVADELKSDVNATKGLLMPRVALTHETQLYPMFEESPGMGTPSAEYKNKKATIDKTHIGLIVYNVKITNYFCPGLYMWNGTSWRPLSEEMHNECK